MSKRWFRRLVLWVLTLVIFLFGWVQWLVVAKGPQGVSKVLSKALHRKISVRRLYWVPPFTFIFEDGAIQGFGGWRSLSLDVTPWLQRDGCLEVRRVVVRGAEGVIRFSQKKLQGRKEGGGSMSGAEVRQRKTIGCKQIWCVRAREVLIQEGRLVLAKEKRAAVFEKIRGEGRSWVFSVDGGKGQLTLTAEGPRIRGWSGGWIRWDGWVDVGRQAVKGHLEAGGRREGPMVRADIDVGDGLVEVNGRMTMIPLEETKEEEDVGLWTGVLRRLRGASGREAAFRWQTRLDALSLERLSFFGEMRF